ncbi:uncharacterized protein LOC129597893 isoform X2 [Paramacrobiotus metropolitanus]|uniref:uncharacterized protein LOC129597893 isoform X2 n=1 Tax=Paramacrobiotus metropolitanus TaxID=2943436 RepID=UPI002445A49A|nr:uncharacterized protein LOC129597893 isoform X2 [Paramacrobiotus metropolitanus]
MHRDLWGYGAVDVVDRQSNIVRRGMIIDTDNKLQYTIDFDYRGHHAENISTSQYSIVPGHADSRAWGSGPPTYYIPYCSNDARCLLYQISADHPWRWYPYKILLKSDSFAVVQIDLGQRTVREILPSECVLYYCFGSPSTYALKHQYVKHSVRLPDSKELHDVTKQNTFKTRWCRQTGTIFLKVDRMRLLYLSPVDHWISPSECKRQLSILREYLCLSSLPWDAEISVSSLSLDTLTDILLSLDVYAQVNCRRVCYNWNAIVQSRGAEHVEIDLVNSRTSTLAWLLHKKVTPQTKLLKLTTKRLRDCHQESDKNFGLRPFTAAAIVKANNIVVPVLVVSHVEAYMHDLVDYSHEGLKLASCFADTCAKLILQKVEVLCCFLPYYLYRSMPTLGLISGSLNTKEASAVRVMLNLLEAACTEVPIDFLDFLQERLIHLHLQSKLLRVMRNWQLGDGRFASADALLQLQNDSLFVKTPLRSLRRMTVFALCYGLDGSCNEHHEDYYRDRHYDDFFFVATIVSAIIPLTLTLMTNMRILVIKREGVEGEQ